jgi:predicted ATPase
MGPIDDLAFSFAGPDGQPRRLVTVLGSAGVGKTTLLSAISSTRPGYAVAQLRGRGQQEPARASFVVADWMLGRDDPARPHALRVTSPNVVLEEPEEVSQLRRREQVLFDRKAQEGGFAFLALSAARWFSRSPVVLTSPERTIFRYDVRGASSFDDAARSDLSRDTKQALSYLSISAALAERGSDGDARAWARQASASDEVMRQVVGRLTSLCGYRYLGADPVSLEPVFEGEGEARVEFDALPTSARHLACFGALAVRTLQAAWPGTDAREAEGVVLIDEVALHQDARVQRELPRALREALPGVQWLLTTACPEAALGCEPDEVLALRKMPASQAIELHEGPLAILH